MFLTLLALNKSKQIGISVKYMFFISVIIRTLHISVRYKAPTKIIELYIYRSMWAYIDRYMWRSYNDRYVKTYNVMIELGSHILIDIEIMNRYIKVLHILIDICNNFFNFNPANMVQHVIIHKSVVVISLQNSRWSRSVQHSVITNRNKTVR